MSQDPLYRPSALVVQLHHTFRHDVTAHAMWTKWHNGDFPSWEAFLMSLVCVLASEKESLMAQALEHERNLTGHPTGTTPLPKTSSNPMDHSPTYVNPPDTPSTNTTLDPNPIPLPFRPSTHIRRSYVGRAEKHP